MSDERFLFNGLDGETGEYLFAERTRKEVALLGAATDKGILAELSAVQANRDPHLGLAFGFKYEDLASAGWGVIFAATETPGVFEALAPLLAHRRALAGDRYRELRGENGYRKDDRKQEFLTRHGAAGSGAVDPRKMPYYLLIVGSPEEIPFDFQFDLDVQYGVGRIHFDTVEEYAQYAQGVVDAEKGAVRRPRAVGFFGAANPDDGSTLSSAKFLVEPLLNSIREGYQSQWEIRTAVREDAKRARLQALLGGADTPALLFTATHGMGGYKNFERLRLFNGSLVCQDWPGPVQHRGPMRDFCFAAEDIASDASVGGTITMMFACYGGGTPKLNQFRDLDLAAESRKKPEDRREPPVEIAEQSILAALPKRLLAHPKGGALAVIAHVERALTCSFQTTGDPDSSHIMPFDSAMKKLLEGFPLGFAMEEFNSRHSELGNDLKDSLVKLRAMTNPPDSMVTMVSDYYDARNYVVLGDPAVRLAV